MTNTSAQGTRHKRDTRTQRTRYTADTDNAGTRTHITRTCKMTPGNKRLRRSIHSHTKKKLRHAVASGGSSSSRPGGGGQWGSACRAIREKDDCARTDGAGVGVTVTARVRGHATTSDATMAMFAPAPFCGWARAPASCPPRLARHGEPTTFSPPPLPQSPPPSKRSPQT